MKIIITKGILLNSYFKRELSYQQIANEHNCSKTTIRRLMKKYNLKGLKTRNKKYDFITKKYLIKKLSSNKITIVELAKQLRIPLPSLRSNIRKYGGIKKLGIPKARNSVAKCSELEAIKDGKKIMGWKKWNIFRNKIINRDNGICQICGNKANQIHHKRPKRKYPKLCWKKDNVIAICPSCHMKETLKDNLTK